MNKAVKSLVFIILILTLTLTALAGCFFDFDTAVDIGKCDVIISPSSYEYTGQPITPTLSIKYANRVLVEGVDYTLDYYDNIDVGTAHVKISGLGNYNGEVVKDFSIAQPSSTKYIYFFYAPGAEFVSGDKLQYVESVYDIVLPTVKKAGYVFLYWTYLGQEVDFDDRASLPSGDVQFEAKFQAITYTVEYVLNGGENHSDNLDEFTVEDIFELQDATYPDKKFAGWYIDKDFVEKITSLEGVTRNLTLYAKFVNLDDTVTLSYVLPSDVNSAAYPTQTNLYPGEPLTRPAAVTSQDGSKKLVWYIDGDMSVRFNLNYMPDYDLTLYARWEDSVYAGFLDRGWYSLSDVKTITSYDDMLAYVEFVLYHHFTSATAKRVTYVSGKDNIEAEILKALNESTFPRMLSVSYAAASSTTCYVYFQSNGPSINEQATLSATSSGEFYPQIGNVFNNYVSNRSDTFDDFAINYLDEGKEYDCTTTDQLFYVLSHGYKPGLVAGSPAAKAYTRFKEILRSICDDRMTDLQKAKAIYDWLVLNVYYDNNVANGRLLQSTSPYQYEAFYIEGVLNGAAVCDGLSKAYAAMCAIEGIDCVRVTGKLKTAGPKDAGHAWNKIQLMGEWFVTDSTWGNRVVEVEGRGHYEYLSSEYFLFTDYVRSEVDNYISYQYTQYVADSDYNYFADFMLQLEIKSGILTTTIYEFDLYVDGDDTQGYSAIDELSYIFEYIDKSGAALVGTSFCIMLGEDMTQNDIAAAYRKYQLRVMLPRLGDYITIYSYTQDGVLPQGSVIVIVPSL